LVPTMGYLHEGHRSLMRAARAATDLVIVTIFVNPLQFGPNEDLDRYPRDLDGDLAACRAESVDVVFAPTVDEMYPRPLVTSVHVAGLTDALCGVSRPTHFDGVTTVVAKLCSIVGACTAFFGRKDAQQLAVVTRMARDLDLPVEVVGCPLVREPDGLALSSRNAYLAPEQRRAALALSRGLREGVDLVVRGERDPRPVVARVLDVLAAEALVETEYVELRDAEELEPVARLDGRLLLAVAARVGATRLIDNAHLVIDGARVDVDLGVVATAS
ncbi:MAG TPA: pantoate--beta-alanine ligase, partial [Acidimicrobiia bacterium]|nr:pantoate--beta-alanine ligase [Acidimicrobiia bacterium]